MCRYKSQLNFAKPTLLDNMKRKLIREKMKKVEIEIEIQQNRVDCCFSKPSRLLFYNHNYIRGLLLHQLYLFTNYSQTCKQQPLMRLKKWPLFKSGHYSVVGP